MPSVPNRAFTYGDGKNVHLSPGFRLDAARVEIGRTAEGDLLIRTVSVRRGTALLEVLTRFDDAVGAEFVAALERERAEAEPPRECDAW